MHGPAVGEELLAAACADTCNIYGCPVQACLTQLVPADRPEIKIGRADLVGMHPLRQLFAKIFEFRAAGAKRRTDHRPEPLRIHAVVVFHPGYGFADDPLDAAAPAAVNGGHHLGPRLPEENRLTVCLLDQKTRAGQVADDRIIALGFALCMSFLRRENLVSMNLFDRDEVREFKRLQGSAAIVVHVCLRIPGIITYIEGGIRGRAHSFQGGEAPMGNGNEGTCKEGEEALQLHGQWSKKMGKAKRLSPWMTGV